MSIRDFFQATTENVTLRKRVQKQEGRIQEMQTGIVQMATRITRLQDDQGPGMYKSNRYPEYEEAVKAISDKYEGRADWGILQTGNIIDIRSAAIVGEGIKVYRDAQDTGHGAPEQTKPGAGPDTEWGKAELDFVDDFFEANSFDHEIPQEFAKEAEIEGKILIKLFWDPAAGPKDEKGNPTGMVAARYIPWLDTHYKVTADPGDYLHYTGVKWEKQKDDPGGDLKEPEFVYKKFGGRINRPNEASPKIAKCLSQIEDLDRALRDLREIDWLFAAPVPDYEYETAKDAKQAQADLDKMNWKIKKATAHTGKFEYKQPRTDGVQNLLDEITMLAKMISGATGCPMQALGFPDMMSVRNSATPQLMEILYAATLKERMIWTGVFEEIIQKATVIFNDKTGAGQKTTKLDASKIKVEIPFTSQQTWDRIEKVWMPLSVAGKISDETLYAQIPGLNVDTELQRQARNKPTLDKARKQIAAEIAGQAGQAVTVPAAAVGGQAKPAGGLTPGKFPPSS